MTNTPTEIRLQLLANGYVPLPGVGKVVYLKGWPTVEVTKDTINSWRRQTRWPDTCIRVEGGLAVIDLDVDDTIETMDEIVAEIDKGNPGLSSRALVRFGKGTKEAWFVRTTEIFGRIHGAGYCPPGKTPDQLTCRVEIFGGGSAREFGSIGAHTRAADGSVVVAYEWQGASPLDTRLADLPALTKAEFYAIVNAVERVLLRRGWKLVPRSKAGEDHAERVYDITDAMSFDLLDGRRLSMPDLRAAAAVEEGLRCSASWLEGPSAINRTRCLVSLTKTGQLAIYETASGVTHLEAAAAPQNPLRGHELDFDRVREKLQELEDRRKFKVSAGDDAMVAATKLIETYAYCAQLRNSVVPIWTDDLDAGITMQAFRTLMMPNITEETGPRGGRVVINPVDLWAASAQRKTVQGLRMRPDKPRPLYEDESGRWINVYTPPSLPQEGGDARPGIEFLEHLIPDAGERHYFTCWLATKMRCPWIPGPAIVMVARKFGTGRGTLAVLIGKLFGERYVKTLPFHIVAGKSYQSQYNDWAASALVVVVNESSDAEGSIHQAKRNAYEHLKELVEPRPVMRQITRKGDRNYQSLTFNSFLICTNHVDALPIPVTDRRFAVVANGEPQTQAYWNKLNAWMDDAANIGAFARWLLSYDVGNYSPFEAPPLTEGKSAMADDNESDLDKAIDIAIANMVTDVFVLEQVIIGARTAAATYGLDLPDRWQPVAKRLTRNRTWRVGIRDGYNWHPQIEGKRYAAYARSLEAARRWTKEEPEALRREILKNGSPTGSGNILMGPFKGTSLNHGE